VYKIKFILSLFCLTLLFSMSSAFASSGVFMVVKGNVTVTSKGKTASAKVGLKVFEGDVIVTGADSRAKIVMADKNVLNISPDSKLEIAVYKNNQQTGEKKVELKVDQGKVRAGVEQKYDDDKNTFRIKTPTAVAGVRGTDFSVSFNPRTRVSQVVTFKGAVAFALNKEGQKPVLVLAGQRSNVDPSQLSPSAPEPVPQNELKNLDMETDAAKSPDSASNSSDKDSPSKESKEKEANGESKKDARDEDKKEAGDRSQKNARDNGKSENSKAKNDENPTSDQQNTQETKPEPFQSNEQPKEGLGQKDSNTQPSQKKEQPNSTAAQKEPNSSPSQREPSSTPAAEQGSLGGGSMVSSQDLSPDLAKQLVDSSVAPRVPTSVLPTSSPVTNTTTQQATQNLITETVRNQIKNRSTKVKVEISR
jgi:hypothetical protein